MQENEHKEDVDRGSRIGRRSVLTQASAFTMAASAGALGLSPTAAADDDRDDRDGRRRRTNPTPLPIVATVPSGLPDGHPLPKIHWLLPGPDGAKTQILDLEAFGLDVDPSLITNFAGFTAYSVLAGRARGSDGETYGVELDVRVMDGKYQIADGSIHHATFGFF